jgi:hypothetical protein
LTLDDLNEPFWVSKSLRKVYHEQELQRKTHKYIRYQIGNFKLSDE